VLRTLPKWFGIEDALLMFVDDSTKMPTFALEEVFPQLWHPRNPALQCIKRLDAV
jgi:hypothetical protein